MALRSLHHVSLLILPPDPLIRPATLPVVPPVQPSPAPPCPAPGPFSLLLSAPARIAFRIAHRRCILARFAHAPASALRCIHPSRLRAPFLPSFLSVSYLFFALLLPSVTERSCVNVRALQYPTLPASRSDQKHSALRAACSHPPSPAAAAQPNTHPTSQQALSHVHIHFPCKPTHENVSFDTSMTEGDSKIATPDKSP